MSIQRYDPIVYEASDWYGSARVEMEPWDNGQWVSLQDHLEALNHHQATTKGSVARNMLAELLKRERRMHWRYIKFKNSNYSDCVCDSAFYESTASRHARIVAQKVLFGQEP